MCFICHHRAQTLFIDSYNRYFLYCKTCIRKVLPDSSEVQKVLEEHASKFILGNQEFKDFHTEETRLALMRKFSKTAHHIIDVGCGNGKFVKFLLTPYASGKILFKIFNKRMYQCARSKEFCLEIIWATPSRLLLNFRMVKNAPWTYINMVIR